MSTDVPKDQMDWREEVWDGARLRRDEARVQEMDRTYVAAGAVHRPSGRMVGFTTMGCRARRRSAPTSGDRRAARAPRPPARHAAQAHRLQELAAAQPEARFISTWNAQENGPMNRGQRRARRPHNGGIAALQKVLG
jgi:hypothetical protein